ncbi:MAG: hypothetical protein IIA92_08535 [Chloroflexi bacterium]|nr:hypothetical protein [Chloroflexota bacterium]
MAILRQNARELRIVEQLIEDPISGLTIQFAVSPDGKTSRLRLFGNLPCGNREFIFNYLGEEAGAGVALTDLCDLPNDQAEPDHCNEADDHV